MCTNTSADGGREGIILTLWAALVHVHAVRSPEALASLFAASFLLPPNTCSLSIVLSSALRGGVPLTTSALLPATGEQLLRIAREHLLLGAILFRLIEAASITSGFPSYMSSANSPTLLALSSWRIGVCAVTLLRTRASAPPALMVCLYDDLTF